jgi:hypothetical protein
VNAQERIDNLLPDPHETARSINAQADALWQKMIERRETVNSQGLLAQAINEAFEECSSDDRCNHVNEAQRLVDNVSSMYWQLYNDEQYGQKESA